MPSTPLSTLITNRWRPALPRAAARPPILLFGLFCGIYALTSAGRLDSADGVVVALTARSILQHHTLALAASIPDVVIGVGGHGYSKYGIAQSLIEMPFVVLGLILRHLTHREQMVEWAISFTNVPVTALGCSLFFLIARRLGASLRLGVGLSLLYGLCTLAWPYAKTDFNEPLQTVTLLSATYAVLRFGGRGQRRWLWAAGGALGLTVLTKSAMLVTVPAFCLALLANEILAVKYGSLAVMVRKRLWWHDMLTRQVTMLAPVLLAVAITLWLNIVRFGSPLDFGYGRASGDAPFSGSFFEGAFGLVLSFNTGLLFFATPVVLGVACFRRFSRRHPAEAVLIGALTASLLVLYGSYHYWAGLAAFGPRYLVPLVPFLLLPAIEIVPPAGIQTTARRRITLAVAGVAAFSLAVQLLGVTVSFGAFSTLTCHQTPCPASLDVSQSELLYDLWLLPTSLAYNLLGHAPHVVLSAYPFGEPPSARPQWQAGLADRLRYFWFVFLPHPLASLAVGCAIGGAEITLCLALLIRSMRPGLRAYRGPYASALQEVAVGAGAVAERRAGTSAGGK